MANPVNNSTGAPPATGVTLKTPSLHLGWMWLPAGFGVLVLIATFCESLIWRLDLIPYGYYLILPFREIQEFGWAGQGIIGAGLLIAGGVLESLSRRNRLYLWKWMVPAFLWLLAGVVLSILHALRIYGHQLQDIVRLSRDLGPEGILGGTLGFGFFGLIFTLMDGRNTKCPQCGKWWCVPLDSTVLDSSTSSGGQFASDGSGWEQTSTTVTRTRRSFRCRACQHEWSGVFASTNRRSKKPLSPFWKDDH